MARCYLGTHMGAVRSVSPMRKSRRIDLVKPQRISRQTNGRGIDELMDTDGRRKSVQRTKSGLCAANLIPVIMDHC